jgi:hypothetical protein
MTILSPLQNPDTLPLPTVENPSEDSPDTHHLRTCHNLFKRNFQLTSHSTGGQLYYLNFSMAPVFGFQPGDVSKPKGFYTGTGEEKFRRLWECIT